MLSNRRHLSGSLLQDLLASCFPQRLTDLPGRGCCLPLARNGLAGLESAGLELREELPGLRINLVAAGFIGGVGMSPVEGADLGG